MDEHALLLLGLLRAQRQHGYQINEFIERNLSRVTMMKKPTAYAILDRLSRDGYVEARYEQAGRRPTRRVYAITPEGEELFQQLLRRELASPGQPAGQDDIGLMFVDELPPAEARACLEQRLAQLDSSIAVYEQAPPHGHGQGVDLAVQRVLHLLRADRDWLSATLTRLQDTQA